MELDPPTTLAESLLDDESPSTPDDPPARASWYNDRILRLRLWAAEYAHPLEQRALKLGSESSCDVQLHDASRKMSREHALLKPEGEGWEIHDLDSKNGLWVDGSRITKAVLQPGAKIRLGRLTLVAESLQFIALRSLVCRFLGWAPARQAAVDEALQALRDGATQRTPLILIGAGDLVPVVMRLHRVILGPDAAFFPDNDSDIGSAIEMTAQGTLCVPIRNRKRASAIDDAVRDLDVMARPRLVFCARGISDAAALGAKLSRLAVIEVPLLSTRPKDEILWLVHETAQDLVREMGAQSNGFTLHDLERLQNIEYSGLADLEDVVRRVIAMRIWGVTGGANKLGIRHSSLSTWARSKNRKLST